jgi:hypothetical protein
MKIILHSPGHNGDIVLVLGIIKKLINDNLDKEFIIIPACSDYLFNELLSDRAAMSGKLVLSDFTVNAINSFKNK